MNPVSDMFRGASKKIETLWRLTNSNAMPQEERDALSFAILAVQFAMRSTTVEQFNEFLLRWPRTLSSNEEKSIDDIEWDIIEEDE